MALDTNGNLRVDFVWGNFPIQDNTQRGEATLDPALDSHDIALYLWSNYPAFTPNVGYQD